jgi:hypothetical protein
MRKGTVYFNSGSFVASRIFFNGGEGSGSVLFEEYL